MSFRTVHIILFLVALAGGAGAQDRLSVTAGVDYTTVGVDETVVYSITVRGSSLPVITTPQQPTTHGLTLDQIVPSTQRSISVVNGRMEQRLTFQWRFRPVREGTAQIGSARVRIGDQVYETEPVTLTVVPQGRQTQARRPDRQRQRSLFDFEDEDPAGHSTEIGARDIFIRAVPNKNTAYVNEQVVVTYYLYVAGEIHIRNSRAAGAWEADGFWREDLRLEDYQSPVRQVIDGRAFNRIPIRRVAFFPTRAGDLRINSFDIQTEASVMTRGDAFGSIFGRFRSPYEQILITAPGVNVRARPLPSPAPSGFSGAVGSYSVTASTDGRSARTGRTVLYTVQVSGSGNLATLDPPRLPLPASVDEYPPQLQTEMDRNRARLYGEKVFTFPVVPRRPGRVTLPAVEFVYFDPDAGTYRTARTTPIDLEVEGAPLRDEVAAGIPGVDEVAGIATTASWRRSGTIHTAPGPWLAGGMLALPLVLLAVLFVVKRHRVRLEQDASYRGNYLAHPLARRHLKQAKAKQHAGDGRGCYDEVARALLEFVEHRWNVPARGFTHGQLDDHLDTWGISEETRSALHELLGECDRARFAPIDPTPDAMASVVERAARLIAILDREYASANREAA